MILLLRKYWKPLLVIAIAVFIHLRVAYIKHERDNALEALKTTTALIRDNEIKRQAELSVSKANGQRDVAQISAKHQAELKIIGVKYETDISRMRGVIADKLRNTKAAYVGLRLPKNDANQPTTDNSDTTDTRPQDEYRQAYVGAQVYIETLEHAGAVCASDYNACKAYVDSEQKRLGVYAD